MFHCECVQTLEQVSQRVSGVSVLGDAQNCGPEQPAVVGPALSSRVGLDNLQRPLPMSAVLLLCF